MIRRIINKLRKIKNGKTVPVNVHLSIVDRVGLDFQKFKTVFDVGAYHGIVSEDALTKNANIEVHLFEPNNAAFEVICKKFAGKNIHLINKAVSDTNGTKKLYLNHFEQTNSLLESNSVDDHLDELTKNIASQNVDVITLDKYCKSINLHEIDFLKIDTQGNSFQVLSGAAELLRKKQIKYIYVETEFIQIYKEQKCFSEIEIFMRSIGYQLFKLYDLHYAQDGRLAWCDSLFIPALQIPLHQ